MCGRLGSKVRFNAHPKTTMDEEVTNARVVARVVKELELLQDILEPVLILNSSCLSNIPGAVLRDKHCGEHLRELCLKNNKIHALVSIWLDNLQPQTCPLIQN